MSDSFQLLKTAVHAFVHRPPDEQLDPNQLRDVMDQLETELDLLCESDPTAARAEMESEAKRFVELLRLDATANPGNGM